MVGMISAAVQRQKFFVTFASEIARDDFFKTVPHIQRIPVFFACAHLADPVSGLTEIFIAGTRVTRPGVRTSENGSCDKYQQLMDLSQRLVSVFVLLICNNCKNDDS
jgi:hypothetical protein